MKLKSSKLILIFIPAVIGFLVWPLTWIYLVQRSTNYQYPHLWDNFSSFGFVACALSAVFGWTALIVGILAATKPNGSEGDDPAAFHGTARFASGSEVAELTTPSEQLQPGSFILSADGQREGESSLCRDWRPHSMASS